MKKFDKKFLQSLMENQRWSPAMSFSVTAQILSKKNILREIFLLLRCFLTEHGWLSKKDVHNGNILLVGVIVQITLLKSRTIQRKAQEAGVTIWLFVSSDKLKLKQKVFKETLISELAQTEPNRQFPECEGSNAKWQQKTYQKK